MARASKPRPAALRETALATQVRFNVDVALAAEIEDTAESCGQDMAAVIRATLRIGLPALRRTPGLCPLLQAGVLRESPE